MLSKYCSNIANKYGIKIGGVNKLVLNLGNKSKYVIHYRNFQLCLSLGMKLTKVYRILKFKQSDWLKNTLILIQTKGKMQLIVVGGGSFILGCGWGGTGGGYNLIVFVVFFLCFCILLSHILSPFI